MKKKQIKAKNKRKIRVILIFLFIFLITAVILLDLFVYPIHKIWLKSFSSSFTKNRNDLRIHFIDVGQGDSTIIEFPDNRTMLIDGGDDSLSTKNTLLKYCAAIGIQKFDYMLATHADTDHVGGLDSLLNTYGANEVFMPYVQDVHINQAFYDFTMALEKSDAKIHISQIFQTIVSTSENFYYMMFLSPTGPDDKNSFYYDESVNDSSAVVYLEYAGINLLLTGDATDNAEKFFIDLYQKGIYKDIVTVNWNNTTCTVSPNLNHMTMYKAGHHGSKSSSSEKLLQVIQPKDVFVSCGIQNAYGHPNIEILARLEKYHCNILRTDILGHIVVTIQENGQYTITNYR